MILCGGNAFRCCSGVPRVRRESSSGVIVLLLCAYSGTAHSTTMRHPRIVFAVRTLNTCFTAIPALLRSACPVGGVLQVAAPFVLGGLRIGADGPLQAGLHI